MADAMSVLGILPGAFSMGKQVKLPAVV